MTMQAAMTELEAISEADAARSEHRSRMDALAHWLSYTKGWTPYEAACLALGVLPNDAHSRGFGQPLPGTKPWPSPMRESWEWRMRRDIKELAERLTTVSGFGFMPAAKQLVAIQQHHGRLPWWAVALANEVCAPLCCPAVPKPLSSRLRGKGSGAFGRSKQTGKMPSSDGGRENHAKRS